ncbi:BCCT family transporter [Demequina zhanjiangensis]|uniref:BCCT family transporter n=1 Tax=Demequina zhanjiangensis TaxID=3051659 RepID=A0ABT8FZ81_9MICO|nr:BCCT family transporter [Demequina sp. SYSU T00b26]MDN4472157.1 BCCT family transporter [Demequina sp. SYSU T00b26]
MAILGTADVKGRLSRAGLAKAVFVPAAIIIFAFVLFALIWPTGAAAVFEAVNNEVISVFGWYYVLIAAVFVVFVLYLGFSQYGDVVLGKDDDEPAFSNFSWYGLLFAAGMGIGLVFYGVSEPLSHFASPPPGVTGAPEHLAEQAMARTFLHWGVHAWAIYIVVGLAVAYAVHRRGRPVSIRWTLEPVLGDRVKGRWGNVIDVAAVVGTLFGLATSLGFGVLQLSAGLDSTGIADPTVSTQVWLIVGITLVTIFSLVTGVQKGMKWLSSTNLVLSGAILLFVLFAGPTQFLLAEFVQSMGAYLSGFISMAFDTSAFAGEAGREWQSSWSTFYWGWWISWAPFVGVFIARVSKGRTVREFVWGVLLVPALLTFLWFSVLGGAAIYRELYGEGGMIGADGTVDIEGSLFTLLEGLPGGSVAIVGAMILIALFFVTSSDSGALVLSMLSTGGNEEPPSWVRVFWATTTATVAIALMVSGGLTALQTAAILTALPFSIVMILMMISTVRALALEHRRKVRAGREEFVEHVASRIGDHFGLEPTTTEIDLRGTRIRWRRRGAASPSETHAPSADTPPSGGAVTYTRVDADEVETVIPADEDPDTDRR